VSNRETVSNPTLTLIVCGRRRADRIEERRACIGKYDGKHPSLTCATTGSKIFIHSPHVINETDVSLQNQMRYLNISKQITAVGAASLKAEGGCVCAKPTLLASQSSAPPS
jgi:hypothetical protein